MVIKGLVVQGNNIMQVSLVSITKPLVEGINTPEEIIVYCARVSNPKNQLNTATAPKLIRYLIDNKHWSPFEMVNVCFEIVTSRAIAQQVLRHRSFSFQEFCMSGDNEIYFDLPGALKNNKRALYKLTLKDIYDKWNRTDSLNIPLKQRIKNMNIRVYDENKRVFTNARITNVYKCGIKPLFKVTLYNGKTFTCTKEHKILTKEHGFISLEEATGLSLNRTKATISKNVFIACNGMPAYQDKDILLKYKQESINSGGGVDWIAKQHGVSYHTIRKWLKKHGICFTPCERAKLLEARGGVWNKGKTGYKLPPHTEATKEKMRKSARKGPECNFWRGGTSTERKQIQHDIKKYRASLMEEYNYKCGMCGNKLEGEIHLHHIIPVAEDITLAREKSNLMPVHRDCHMKHHKMNGDYKTWREKATKRTLTVQWSKIKYVEYVGEHMTYDLEVDHDSHNYVANGVVVHNSQRYSQVSCCEPIELRKQASHNRQSSVDVIEDDELRKKIDSCIKQCFDTYHFLIENGVARETARFVLPSATQTRLYMNGSLRSWIHYLQVRTDEHTQKEHREIALAIQAELEKLFPNVFAALSL